AVRHVGAKRRHLDLEGGLDGTRTEHLDDAKAGADGDGAPEEAAHLLRGGAGGDVVVLRRPAEQLVADAAAGPQRSVAGFAQPAHDINGKVAFGHALSIPQGDSRHSSFSTVFRFVGWGDTSRSAGATPRSCSPERPRGTAWRQRRHTDKSRRLPGGSR